MRVFTSILGLILCLGAVTRAGSSDAPVPGKEAAPGKPGGSFVVGISPFLDTSVKDSVFRSLVRLIVEDLPLNSRLEVYDAYHLRSITHVAIPGAKVFNSPKTRANQFAPAIGEIKQFLAHDTPRPGAPKPGFEGAIRLPQFCDFLSQERPPRDGDAKQPLLLFGSPLYQDAREPAFSMVDGYFPSDGHLHASRDQSIFGFNSGDGPTQGPAIYWVYFGDPWISDLHREKVARFWTLYLERRGGRLASFSSDLTTALSAYDSAAPGPGSAANGWVVDAKETNPEMLRAGRSVKIVDWLTGDLPDANPPPPKKMTGPMKIGIRWKENIDLDLYATPFKDAETLFFQHAQSPEGYYFKDQRSSPGKEYEYIEFESPVDVRKLKAFVNFYAGSCAEGPHGEVRIEFANRIYKGKFEIASSDGNKGRSGPSQSEFWTRIPVLEILGLEESSPQAASLSR